MTIVREMTPEDIAAVYEVEAASFHNPWMKASFEDELRQSQTDYLVAEDEGKIVGYIGIWDVLGEGNITNVAVAPAYRRQGIGRLLIESLLLRHPDLKAVYLEVRESNTAARKLYEAFGFEAYAVRSGYYRNPHEDAVCMRRFSGKNIEGEEQTCSF